MNCAPGREIKRRETLLGWRFSLGSEQVKAHIEHPSPGVDRSPGKIGPFVGWRGSGTNRRAEGSLDSACEESACACSCQAQSREGTLKLHMMVTGSMQAP